MRKMLFSIPESGWRWIAAAATVFFVIGIRALLPRGTDVPDELRSTVEQQYKQGTRVLFVLGPLMAASVLVTNLFRPGQTLPVLFLYSVAFASIPVAVFPFRSWKVKNFIAQQENPDAEVKPGGLAMAWCVGVLIVATLAAVFALMTTEYGMRRH